MWQQAFSKRDTDKIFKYQRIAGNIPDLQVFFKDCYAGPGRGGFNWHSTTEGWDYWATRFERFATIVYNHHESNPDFFIETISSLYDGFKTANSNN